MTAQTHWFMVMLTRCLFTCFFYLNYFATKLNTIKQIKTIWIGIWNWGFKESSIHIYSIHILYTQTQYIYIHTQTQNTWNVYYLHKRSSKLPWALNASSSCFLFFCHFSRVGSRESQQRRPDFPASTHLLQLVRWDSKVFLDLNSSTLGRSSPPT